MNVKNNCLFGAYELFRVEKYFKIKYNELSKKERGYTYVQRRKNRDNVFCGKT